MGPLGPLKPSDRLEVSKNPSGCAPLERARSHVKNKFLGMTGVSLRLPCVRPNNTLACIKLPFHVCFAWTVSGSQGPRGPAGPLRSHGLTRSARGSILRLPTCPVNGFLGEFQKFPLRARQGPQGSASRGPGKPAGPAHVPPLRGDAAPGYSAARHRHLAG